MNARNANDLFDRMSRQVGRTGSRIGDSVSSGWNNLPFNRPARRGPDASSVIGALGFFAVGTLVGVGLGMMLAPKPGRELRADLNERMLDARNRMQSLPLGRGRSHEEERSGGYAT